MEFRDCPAGTKHMIEQIMEKAAGKSSSAADGATTADEQSAKKARATTTVTPAITHTVPGHDSYTMVQEGSASEL